MKFTKEKAPKPSSRKRKINEKNYSAKKYVVQRKLLTNFKSQYVISPVKNKQSEA